MYKDKDRQREANRKAQAKRRAKGMTKGVTLQGMTDGVLPILEAPTVTGFTKTKFGPKRGKDIKIFEDLPPDVQQTIDKMSVVDGKIDQTIKVNRTAIAVHYQHLFPDRYYSTGVA